VAYTGAEQETVLSTILSYYCNHREVGWCSWVSVRALIKAEAKGISTMAKLLVIGNFTLILPYIYLIN